MYHVWLLNSKNLSKWQLDQNNKHFERYEANVDLKIKMIKFTTKISKEDISFKAGAFADDIGVLCGGDLLSIKKVF